MCFSCSDIDSFLDKQHLIDLELIPGNLKNWSGQVNMKCCSSGKVIIPHLEIDACAHLDNRGYRVLIAMNKESNGEYILNGIPVGRFTFYTPCSDVNIVFPNSLNHIHIEFEKDFFEEIVAKNHVSELIGEDKYFSFDGSNADEFIVMAIRAFADCSQDFEYHMNLFAEKLIEVHLAGSAHEGKVFDKKRIFNLIYPYFKENIHEDLSMTEVCEAFGMSRRNFERSFKFHFGLTPSNYFRRMKLMSIRKELLSGKSVNINSTLEKYKIRHLGHFGQFYKSVFGETVSQSISNRFKNA